VTLPQRGPSPGWDLAGFSGCLYKETVARQHGGAIAFTGKQIKSKIRKAILVQIGNKNGVGPDQSVDREAKSSQFRQQRRVDVFIVLELEHHERRLAGKEAVAACDDIGFLAFGIELEKVDAAEIRRELLNIKG